MLSFYTVYIIYIYILIYKNNSPPEGKKKQKPKQ